MESLVANYASSDDEEQDPPIVSRPKSVQTNTSSSILSSLPQPKSLTPPSSSLFQFLPQPSQTSKLSNPLLGVQEERSSGAIPTTSSSILSSLPQPKQISSKSPLLTTHSDIHHDDPEHSERSSRFRSSNSLFSSLPQPTSQPMSQSHQPPVVNPSSSGQKNRRVVQLAPLLYPNPAKTALLDEDDEDEEQERKTSKGSDFMGQAPTVTSFLSSLPAARNTATLGVQGSSGSGRKAIIETDTPALDTGNSDVKNNVIVDQNAANDGSYNGYAHYPSEIGHASNVYYDGTANYQPASDLDSGVQSQTGVTGSENSYYGNYDTYGCHNGYVDDGQYGNNWADGSGMGMQKESGVSEDAFKLSGKRGRSQVPEDIIEVKQDELMKNRPREDQTKLTGIAFGPSYKPVSTKGKPSKLHKRKHQISSLYFDMKQKEMELSERRAKGMLTKAETQAKYGW